MSEKAKIKMQLATWEFGNRKAKLTNLIKGLSVCECKENDIIQKAIKILEERREKLKLQSAFD